MDSEPDNSDPDLDRDRFNGVVISLFCIAWAVVAMLGLWSGQQTSAALPLLAFASYMVAVSCLITFTARRLYVQHELRRFRLDLGSLIALMTLTALPFCFANLIWSCIDSARAAEMAADKQRSILLISAVLGFFILPAFYLTEASFSFLANRRRRYKRM